MAMRNPETAHWRDSSRTPRLFFMDAYAIFPFVLWLLHIRWWTFYIALVAFVFFVTIEKFGFKLPVFLRALRSFFAGNRRIASPWYKLRRPHL